MCTAVCGVRPDDCYSWPVAVPLALRLDISVTRGNRDVTGCLEIFWSRFSSRDTGVFGLAICALSSISSPGIAKSSPVHLLTTSCYADPSRSIASLFSSVLCFIMARQASTSRPGRNQQSTTQRTRSRMPSLFNTIRVALYGTWFGAI